MLRRSCHRKTALPETFTPGLAEVPACRAPDAISQGPPVPLAEPCRAAHEGGVRWRQPVTVEADIVGKSLDPTASEASRAGDPAYHPGFYLFGSEGRLRRGTVARSSSGADVHGQRNTPSGRGHQVDRATMRVVGAIAAHDLGQPCATESSNRMRNVGAVWLRDEGGAIPIRPRTCRMPPAAGRGCRAHGSGKLHGASDGS